jgi:pimeloyl-[acyl-carrier protein] methyl ester esterase
MNDSSKKNLYLAHGWGMPSAVWTPILPQLEQRFTVQIIDLPGYGKNPNTQDAYDSFEHLAQQTLKQIQKPGVFLGWSLGGMLGIAMTKIAPEKIQQLITVASNLKFIQHENWPSAISLENLKQFAEDLNTNYHATLSRFLSLQVHGCESAKEIIRLFKKIIPHDQKPCEHALSGGLKLLERSDLREEVAQLSTQTMMIFGRADKLVPHQIVSTLNDAFPAIKTALIAGAAHAPFLSHPSIFLKHVDEFCYAPS